MLARPIQLTGIMKRSSTSWQIDVDGEYPSFEDEMNVRIVLWDDRTEGTRSEVEEIARVQQLEPEIVALALASEGLLRTSEFASRLGEKN